MFGNQNIFYTKDRKNGSRRGIKSAPDAISCKSIKSYISMWMSKSGPEQRADAARAEDGGPDRTRTYDPRLIKAVL